MNGLGNAGDAFFGDGEEEVGTGDKDTAVVRERRSEAVSVGSDIFEGDAALVCVNRVRDAADTDEDEAWGGSN